MNINDKITLEENGFGNFNKEMIAMLINSVMEFFANLGVESEKKIVIIHNDGDPECCASSIFNTHIIKLSSKDDFWCQWIYQFAHEFCHHIIDGKLTGETAGLMWLEESLCHIASYVCLDQFSKLCASRDDLRGYSTSVVCYLLKYLTVYDGNSFKTDIPCDNSFDLSNHISQNNYELLQPYIKEKWNILTSIYSMDDYKFIARALFQHFYNNKNLWKILPFLGDMRQWAETKDLYEHLKSKATDDYLQSLEEIFACLM